MNCMSKLLCLASVACLTACGSGESKKEYQPSREERGDIHILRLVGNPYEMGRQHAELMTEEIQQLADFAEQDQGYSLLLSIAETGGLTTAAIEYSYPDVIDECRGMTEVLEDEGVENWPFEHCVTAAYLLVVLENTVGWTQGGCSQFVATRGATSSGEMIHARNLDWPALPPLVEHPTLIVRRPEDKTPYIEVGFPGCVFSLSGVNANGLVIGNNECYAETDFKEEGRSHPQMARQILQEAETLDDARTFFDTQQHATAETLVISDPVTDQAAAFEMSATHMGERGLSADGVVYATNHFEHQDMREIDVERGEDHDTRTRYTRFGQLLEPGGGDSLHGKIDPAAAIAVLRDAYNPFTEEIHPPDLIDGGGSIGNNGSVHSMIFLPARRTFYVSMGKQPVPPSTFVGFSIDELLEEENATPPDPASYE